MGTPVPSTRSIKTVTLMCGRRLHGFVLNLWQTVHTSMWTKCPPSPIIGPAPDGMTGAAREMQDATRTKRAEAPGGRDRLGSACCQDCDRRNRGYGTEATGEARERLGGVEGTSGEHHRGPAPRDRGARCSGAVGMMKHLRKNNLPKPAIQAEPSEIRAGRFLDYVLEMYAPPSSVKLRSVVNGRAGFAQDKMRIRGYYKSAAENALGRKD